VQSAALALDGRARRALIAALLGLLALPFVALLCLIAVVAQLVGQQPSGGQLSAEGEIPAALVAVFDEAARVWHVNRFLLASIAYQESTFGLGLAWRQTNSAGCIGLMQIGIGGACGNTWDSTVHLTAPTPIARVAVKDAYRYGRRPNDYAFSATDHPALLDSFDQVMAAAVHLRAKVSGQAIPDLDDRAYRAACGYFGACVWAGIAYAPDVLARARRYQAQSLVSARPPLGLDDSALRGGRLSWPTLVHTVTSPFCERRSWETCHPGIDIPLADSTPIHAASDGRITLAAPTAGYGNYTCIQHTQTLSTCYAHQHHLLVSVGQYVRAGQIIGTSDCTGRCYGPHLHFEVRVDGRPTCPAAFLNAPVEALCAAGWQQRSGS
jgi:murein DD-endopeptidase MepM/ murein hydrolase activator NlpD